MNHVLAQGIWCEDCAVFEQDTDVDKEQCPACGCHRTRHLPVKVVEA